jgi:hypothetical protein
MSESLLKELTSLANDLDKAGLSKEADKVDKITKEITKEASLCLMLLSGLIGCKKSIEEKVWGTDTKDPQPIAFEALDSEDYVLFDQNDFIAKGQAAFKDGCVKKIEWIYEIGDSVEVNEDGTVLWRYVNDSDPVIVASGYPPGIGRTWDVLFEVRETTDEDGEVCHLALTVKSMSSSGGYSSTVTYD